MIVTIHCAGALSLKIQILGYYGVVGGGCFLPPAIAKGGLGFASPSSLTFDRGSARKNE